jgi:hypothetical protein
MMGKNIFILVFFCTSQIHSQKSSFSVNADTSNGYAYFPLNGGPCGLLEHDASTGIKENASIGEFSRNGVSCISVGSYYSSQDWGGNGVMNPNKYLYFYLGPLTNDNIMVLRKQDRLSFKAMRNGEAPDTIAVYYVDRYSNHTILLKTYLPDNEWKSFVMPVPIASIPVISSIRFYAWSALPSHSNVVDGILSVDDVQISFGISNSISTGLEKEKMPQIIELSNAYPNPFNPSTTINFTVPSVRLEHLAKEAGQVASTLRSVSLKVYDILGREVQTLVDEYKQPGYYKVIFSANGSQIPSGVYYYRLHTGDYSETKKMILLK